MHEGHRSRLVSKIKSGGIVYEHELMEILLFNACPRKDLNATAHAVVSRFGSIGGALRASAEGLAEVDGVGVNMAEYLAVLGKAMAAVRGGKSSFATVKNVHEFINYIDLRPVPQTDETELFCLDKDGRVRRVCIFKAKAGFRAAPAETAILKLLSVHAPYGLFVAERRVHGGSVPDRHSDELSDRIDRVARLCGANLYDYCVVGGDGGFYSYKMHDRTVFAAPSDSGEYYER